MQLHGQPGPLPLHAELQPNPLRNQIVEAAQVTVDPAQIAAVDRLFCHQREDAVAAGRRSHTEKFIILQPPGDAHQICQLLRGDAHLRPCEVSRIDRRCVQQGGRVQSPGAAALITARA